MKLFWLIPALILIFFVKLSLEKFDNTMREQDARALFKEARKSDNENTEATILLAIEKLSYSQLFDKKALVNSSLVANYYRILAGNLSVADNQSDVDELLDTEVLADVDNRSDADKQRDANKSKEYYRQAKLSFLDALKIQPTKSRNWALLAMTKWDLQEKDDDYLRYIMNAHRYGQHEPQTHIKLVQLGAKILSNDVTMPSELKPILLHHLTFGMSHSKSAPSILYGIIRNGKIRDGFCSWIEENETVSTKLKCV